jgi:hypothetical protein
VLEDDAMGKASRRELRGEESAFGPDTIEEVMRARVRETIEMLVEEELEATLGARSSERVNGALLAVYLAGTNTRRVRGALACGWRISNHAAMGRPKTPRQGLSPRRPPGPEGLVAGAASGLCGSSRALFQGRLW